MAKAFVKIDRKVLFEILDAILESEGSYTTGYTDFYPHRWDKNFYQKVKNIRKNS